jgi:hypothetical protein
MSKTIKIKNKIEFVKNFLSPVSKMSDSAILKVDKNVLSCLTCVADNSVILYIDSPIETDFSESLHLNCPDIKKLIKAVDTVKEETELVFLLENNNLSYKDSSVRFKYHLLEDNIIKNPKLNLNKLKETEFNVSFSITGSDIKELIRGSIFSSDSNKIYFSINEEGVFAELTDKTRNNIDTINLKLCESYQGDMIENFPISFEIFRIMESSQNKNINVKINNKLGLVIFDFESNYTKMTYIVPSLIK